MIEATRIAQVLGGSEVLKRHVGSLDDLSSLVRNGLPKDALRTVAQHLFSDPKTRTRTIYRIVPEATYKRRKGLLNPIESERTERLARVVATAEFVWDDLEEARRFLTTPHPELGDCTPLDVSMTELGARQVEEILWKIFHGIPA